MPPKKSKKPSRNGYWEFVLECRDKQPNKHMNMQELQTYASRKWSNLSKEERQPYEARAQVARDTYQPTKLTTDGLEIEEVERKEKEQVGKIQDMKNDITRTLKAASFAMNLDEHMFLIIHINHLTHYPNEDRFFICEIAIAALNLKNGIEEVYHSIVKPGKLPLGFYGGALAHSKETHQLIDLAQEDPCQDNTQEVFGEVTQFLKKYRNNHSPLIVYADDKTFDMTTNVINNFRDDFRFDEEIKVYNLQYMFFALRNAVAGKTVWQTETFAFSELEKDVYSYTPNIACAFHEMSDISIYCSKSFVTRYCYTICDHCCAELRIQLVPGFHVPNKSRVVTESRSASKDPSVYSNDDSRSAHSARVNNSLSSTSYDDDYPALASKSSASSVVSFSSMKTVKSASTPKKTAARLEQSFKALSLKEAAKRDHGDLAFPKHGTTRNRNNF
ncbi:hypothetical protein Zmor_010981 [Zophobas morio]|uniref:HMG box domain-containing protein n=1 Tax=Zophobas morio TaxID=2755281 RepID=A0AA38MJ79_9CUCU|nr:hypothetical protein Zmor_010981 [Zophobas morio]